MPADQIPDSVYLDAARAYALIVWGDEDGPKMAKHLTKDTHFRAAVESAYRAGPSAALREFAVWLISMDDPEDVLGRAARQTVTLTAIIQRAREALDTAPGTPEALRDHAATAPRDPEGRWTSDDR
jgi:hypothetical protein